MKKAQPVMAGLFLNSGSPTWTRTRDLRINSPSLYRLSYQGIEAGIITAEIGFGEFFCLPALTGESAYFLLTWRAVSWYCHSTLTIFHSLRWFLYRCM